MPKIYTKKGDDGTTRLYDGSHLSKGNIICSVMGEVDELSSRIGIVYSLIPKKMTHNHEINTVNISTSVQKIGCSVGVEDSYKPVEKFSISYFNLKEVIASVQQILQRINSILATNLSRSEGQEQDIDGTLIKKLENYIDFMSVELPGLTKFILPGVTQCDAHVHLCRTQTRKVERLLVQIRPDVGLGENAYKYMNRLSDFFFTLARWVCYKENLSDRF